LQSFEATLMNRTIFMAFSVAAAFTMWPEASLALVAVGPGTYPYLYVTDNSDYRVLAGTQIVTLSQSGPPSTFVVPIDAIEFRGGGHIQIDGGFFQGGDATYLGANGTLNTAAGADALHLRQSTGEVHSGAFIGGNARSTSWLGNVEGGSGLILVESDVTIFGGSFTGGSTEQAKAGGGLRQLQEPAAIAYDGSAITLHGGVFDGAISLVRLSRLTIFGTELNYANHIFSGRYADGTPFMHDIALSGAYYLETGPGRLTLVQDTLVPEPPAMAFVLPVIMAGLARRRPASYATRKR
jgi:hypothetical protein